PQDPRGRHVVHDPRDVALRVSVPQCDGRDVARRRAARAVLAEKEKEGRRGRRRHPRGRQVIDRARRGGNAAAGPWCVRASVEADLADQLELVALRLVEVAVERDGAVAPVAAAFDADVEHLEAGAGHQADVAAAVAVADVLAFERVLQVPGEHGTADAVDGEAGAAALADVDAEQQRHLDRLRLELEAGLLDAAFGVDELADAAEHATLVAAEPEAGAPAGAAVDQLIEA